MDIRMIWTKGHNNLRDNFLMRAKGTAVLIKANKHLPEYFVVDDGRERQPVEGLVAVLPDLLASLWTEAVLALKHEWLVSIMLLPAVHLDKRQKQKQKLL